MSKHLIPQIHSANRMATDNVLHVVGVISNHAQWHSRYRLFREWLKEMRQTPNVKVHVVELAHGDHCFELACDMEGDSYLQLRSPNGHLWLKEAMINAAVRYLLPPDWRYMAWVDCDVHWPEKSWAQATIKKLQDYQVVQPWATCVDIGPFGEASQNHESFAYVLNQRLPMRSVWAAGYKYCHTGFAWACRREFWENVHGLMGFCLVGSADHHQAWAMINRVNESVHGQMSEGFKRACLEWQKRAYAACGGRVGVVTTRIEHSYHGSKQRRKYRERWEIFIEAQFDPYKNLAYDAMGLPYVVSLPDMEEEIRRYNLARAEDAIGEP